MGLDGAALLFWWRRSFATLFMVMRCVVCGVGCGVCGVKGVGRGVCVV